MLGSSPYSAQLAAELGRPYAFALQFGDSDMTTALRIYRDNFKPSNELERPHALVSVSAVVADEVERARREASSMAMAMLRMFKRESFIMLPPNEVESYPATANEHAILDMYTNRSYHGTASTVATRLERLHEETGVDEVMLVLGSHTPGADERTVELLADHHGMPQL